jgi:glyoxylase-like metal-dependent hydrolase (beta-lactamase superfamily II)
MYSSRVTGMPLPTIQMGLGTLLLYGPSTGRFLNSSKEAGIDAKDIEPVVMTHAHVDHLGENNVDDGTSNLPHA